MTQRPNALLQLSLALLLALAALPLAAAAGDATATGDRVVDHYLAIHDALAADRTDGVAERASDLAAAARRQAKGSEHAATLAAIAAAAEAVAGDDIEALRTAFEPLSDALVAYVEEAEVGGIGVYHCSMRPASWVQLSGPVRNPYYGASMLACGTRRAG